MGRKVNRNTKSKIVTAAWKLFYEQGYDNTTVEEIIWESGTSKGSFYHYFDGKDALLGSLAYLFDEKYEELVKGLDDDVNRLDFLFYLNAELFEMVESSIDIDLLTRLYSTQLTTRGQSHLLDHNRYYYKLLKKIVTEGQARGEITKDYTVSEIVRLYAMCERALLYDWCLNHGEYPLKEYSQKTMKLFLGGMKKV